MQQQPRLPLWFLVANWALVLLALATGWFLGSRRLAELPEPQATALHLIYETILASHVEPQDGKVLLDRALKEMVGKLDPYSRYVPPSEVAAYDEANTGHYEGIGVLMVQHGEDLVVHYPLADGPAERAGLAPGDRIVAVDDRDLRTTPIEQRRNAAAELVRGPAGTTVRLRVARDTGESDVTVQRSGVQQESVKWTHFASAEHGLGYVYIGDFHRGVSGELRAAIDRLQAERPLRGLVIDLRFDGGGSLEECVAIANMFLPNGTIVSQRRRGSEIVETFAAKPEKCAHPDLPLVILVNGGSASASEVLSGALQDHGRAPIVGARTYGKGFVNTVFSWGEQPFKLKLTTAHFYTPSGRNIERPFRDLVTIGRASAEQRTAYDAGGISPDVPSEVTPEQHDTIEMVLASREPPARHLAAFTAVAAKYGVRVPGPPVGTTDPQLAQALTTLRERMAGSGKDK